jgi:hypothetical protein
MSLLTATAHPNIGAADVVLNTNTVTDTFTRSTSNGWGSANTGQAWTTSGGSASDFSTNGTKAIQSASTTAVLRNALIPVGVSDMRVRATVNLDTGTITGNTASAWVAARVTDTNNYYAAQLEFRTDDSVRLAIIERVAGSLSGISSTVTIATSFAANQQFTVEIEAAGSTVRATAWATATSSNPGWLVEATDTSLTSGTQAALISRLESGNSNALPVQFQWDNVAVLEAGDLWTIARVYPDGSSSELLGLPVYTSGGYAVLWDTVLPLDIPIYYTAGSDVSSIVLTSNTITVTGTGAGWLKDPAQPINDIPFTTCPTGTCPLDVDNDDTSVSFLRIGQAQFQTASGVFAIIDAARPRTVAQTRKARESSLAILSHTLAAEGRVEDILASGRNLFLQLAARYGWAWRTWACDYIAVADVTEERPPSPNMTWPHRAWGLPFTLARAPFVPTQLTGGNGVGVSGATYGDATATGRTYAQRTATGNTYLMSSRGENL